MYDKAIVSSASFKGCILYTNTSQFSQLVNWFKAVYSATPRTVMPKNRSKLLKNYKAKYFHNS